MEWVQSLIDSNTTPVFTAFLLGLLTAVSPCPLATNITAIGFISKDIDNRHKVFIDGLLYTFGRVVVYTGLGFVLIPLLREGAGIFSTQKVISSYGGIILPPVLVLIGFFMLFSNRLNLPKFGFNGNLSDGKFKKMGGVGAFLLGVLFTLAFCPSSGIFYFGMLIPMSAMQSYGYWLPVIFAVATALPVVIIAWILAYSVAGIGKFYNNIKIFQKWLNIVIALIFIFVGVYYAIIFY